MQGGERFPNKKKKEVNVMTCKQCGYCYKTEKDKYPTCHYDGPDCWAPCELDDEEPMEEADEEPMED
jgi:hypothetical protein